MAIFKLPGITTAQRTGLVLGERELVYDTDLNAVYQGDGTTAGGVLVGGGGGATNLAWVPGTSAVTSDTGTDAVLTVADGTNPGLMASADFTKLAAITGTNTGDQTSIAGITGTKAQFDTAVTDGNFMYVGDAPTAHTQTAATISDFNAAADARIGAASINALADVVITTASAGQVLKYNGTNWINDTDATGGGGVADGDKGDITVSAAGATWTIDAGAVTLAKLAAVATGTIFYRKTAGTGTPEVQTLATLKTDLGLTGTNSGDQTITLTGAVTGSGNGSFATSLGDFTKAQLNAAVSDGDPLYVGDVTSNATHTGDATGATALTLATVNSNVGPFGSATQIPTFTVNAKGLTTAAANVSISIPASQVSDFSEAVDDRVATLLVAGAGVTLTYNDAANTLTVAASGGGADPWTYVVLGSDFTTSSATAVPITGLSFIPDPNTRYEFEAVLLTRTATATVGPRPGIAWPTPAQVDGVATIIQTSAAGTSVQQNGNISAAVLAPVGGVPTTTGSWPATIRGVIQTGATVTLGLRLQLASETAATNVTVKAGSFLKYRTY